ncbi:hypothetical protein A2716_01620 [candidate division WWE3 bacterium RIFCSPHIGHO2_01_FULL_40_23]|uniref:Uncharacterized protein n=1 Tax=candidate division WWE3 bacterium RIFCSPLOWO2_01_FULL_41_18 TaxID=1802625 RepID=A0A1F4VEK1_UNCKA|nr:MAG: hypothetical protein A2716_01620 [candidate division WWE3 bacterium RIFCSPHIGHO2_01_FULL_40_23]OGC55692.1 MAG: hypothetical protein A3A78_01470 [candidate division WWE3 bacterium RIFCSPLOWO2_01_FULL_41_18]
MEDKMIAEFLSIAANGVLAAVLFGAIIVGGTIWMSGKVSNSSSGVVCRQAPGSDYSTTLQLWVLVLTPLAGILILWYKFT